MEEKYIGRICPYCKNPINAYDSISICPACGTAMHTECFNETGRCVAVGCSGGADRSESGGNNVEENILPVEDKILSEDGQDVSDNNESSIDGDFAESDNNAFPENGYTDLSSCVDESNKNIASEESFELKEDSSNYSNRAESFNGLPKFCPECGTKVEFAGEYCMNCGFKLTRDSSSSNNPTPLKNKRVKKIIIAIAAALCVAAVSIGSGVGIYKYTRNKKIEALNSLMCASSWTCSVIDEEYSNSFLTPNCTVRFDGKLMHISIVSLFLGEGEIAASNYEISAPGKIILTGEDGTVTEYSVENSTVGMKEFMVWTAEDGSMMTFSEIGN